MWCYLQGDYRPKKYAHRDATPLSPLNEIFKEHQTVQELKKQVAELTAGLHKVSIQLRMSRVAQQRVVSEP
jgi:hypothetical protein